MVNKQLNLAICGYGGIGAHHAATIIPETSQHFKVIGIPFFALYFLKKSLEIER